MKKVFSLFLLVALALAFAGTAESTVTKPISLEMMAKDSSIVVHGVVTGVKTEWHNNTIRTLVTLKVTEYVKGEGPEEVVVKTIGGTIGNLTVAANGVPKFELAEEVVLFLNANNNKHTIFGIGHGKFKVKDTSVAQQFGS